MAGEQQAWWHARGSERSGPFTEEELRQKAGSGEIGEGDLVWADGMSEWVPAASVDGLLPVKRAGAQPPPLPSRSQPPVLPARSGGAGWSDLGANKAGGASASAGQHQRVYHAPRLDKAFDRQPQVEMIGKFVVPAVTLMTFVLHGGVWGILAVIGLAAYWMVLLKNKGDLELAEKELYGLNAKDGLQHDISDLALIRFRYGPGLAFFGSVLAVLFVITKWGVRFMWENRNG